MSRKQLQARYDQDTAEQLEQFAEDKGISRSEALRRAARDKLRAEGYREVAVPADAEEEDADRTPIVLGSVDEFDEIDDMANASINETARLLGGVAIALGVVVVLLKQFGII